MAKSLGDALFQTSYIANKGDYSDKQLVTDFEELLKQAASKKFDPTETQLGFDKRPYVVLRAKTGNLEQAILFPEDLISQSANIMAVIKKDAPTIATDVKVRLKDLKKLF